MSFQFSFDVFFVKTTIENYLIIKSWLKTCLLYLIVLRCDLSPKCRQLRNLGKSIYVKENLHLLKVWVITTLQKMKIFLKNSTRNMAKSEDISGFIHTLKKLLKENFFYCAAYICWISFFLIFSSSWIFYFTLTSQHLCVS